MKKITAVLILLLQAHLASAAPDLIEMASTEDSFSIELIAKLKPLSKEQLNETRDPIGRTILHILAMRSHQARGLAALLAGADPNAADNGGRTPIFDVVEASDSYFNGLGDLMYLEMLTLRGAEVNAHTKGGLTPLAIAVDRNDLTKAAFLIRRGAQPSPTDIPADKSPLALAQAKGDARMLALLAKAAKSQPAAAEEANLVEPPKASEVSKAINAVDLDALKRLVAAGWNINEVNEKGQTALFRAADGCRPELVTELLFLGADPNLADANGKTPLMNSLRFLGIEGQRTTAALLMKGADVNAKTKDGQTALTVAASAGHDFGVMWLIAGGADPLAPTPKGPLVEYANHGPTIYLLKKFGLPEKKPKPPETDPAALVITAIRRGELAAVEKAFADGMTLEVLGKKDPNVIALAANSGYFEIVDFLVKNGADINAQYPSSGWHILHSLAGWGPAQGDPVVAAGHIQQLIKRGANPDIQAKDGMTALMISAKQGIMEANTDALIQGGASLTIRNKEGLTVLGVAKKYGHTEMAEYLQSLGAKE